MRASATASRNGKPHAADPPHAEQAEADLAASLVLMPELIPVVRALVDWQDVYKPHVQVVVKAIFTLADKSQPVSATTIFDRLIADGEREAAHGLQELVDRVPHGAHAVHHAQQVHEAAIKRRLFYRAGDIIRAATDPLCTAADLVDFVDGLTAFVAEKKPDDSRFAMMTSAELATGDFSGEYIIEDILAAHEFCILVGPKKSLKTTLALYMAFCIALGRSLFGVFKITKPRRVGFCSGESGPGTLQDALRRVAMNLRRSPTDMDGVVFTFQVPQLDLDADIAAIERRIVEHNLEVLFLDCFYRMLGEAAENVSNVFQMGRILAKLLDLQQRTGCTIVLLHHTRMHAPYAEPDLDSPAFAGTGEAARQWILLARREKYDPDNCGHHKLWINVGGSMGHSELFGLDIDEGSRKDPGGRRLDIEMVKASECRTEAATAGDDTKEEKRKIRKQEQLRDDQAAILQVVARLNAPESKTGIRDGINFSSDRFAKAFAALLLDKQLSPIEAKKGNNRSYEGYCLPSRLAEFRNRLQQTATGRPMQPDAIASDPATSPIGGVAGCSDADGSAGDVAGISQPARCETEGAA